MTVPETAIAIASLGAITAVGDDVRGSMAGIYSGLQLFDTVGEGSDGEPLSGGASGLARKSKGIARLGALGLLALDECTAEASLRGAVPIVVCGPALDDGDGSGEVLLDRMTADLPLLVDRRRSRVLLGGRAAMGEALELARSLLREGGAPACLMVAVDSLIDGPRLRRLVEDGRVRDGNNRDGFLPGEAAVALLLTARVDATSLAVISGVGAGTETWTPGGQQPFAAGGLTAAFERAVGAARVDPSHLAALVHDHSGSRVGAEELAMACQRPPLTGVGEVEVFAPAISTGEIGAASGALSLAMAAFFISERVIGPTLVAFLSEGSRRSAAVVMPAPRGKGG